MTMAFIRKGEYTNTAYYVYIMYNRYWYYWLVFVNKKQLLCPWKNKKIVIILETKRCYDIDLDLFMITKRIQPL